MAVIVPAHNEADTIQQCVTAILNALDELHAQHSAARRRSVVVVGCDRCHDNTAMLARAELGDRGVVLEGAWSGVGQVRAAATEAALQHLGGAFAMAASQIWLANTDADSVVHPTWIAKQLALAAQGWAAVAGTVELHDPAPALAQRFAAMYTIESDGTHHHVHGANLGVRADAYLDAGGWPPLGLAEDHALLQRVRAKRWPIISSAAVRVHTSARLHGRAPGGFATTLRTMPPPTTISSPTLTSNPNAAAVAATR